MIIFAHRGAPRTRAEENTLAAFQRALALGATGLESDIGLTADGVPVLYHRRPIGRGLRLSRMQHTDLPPHVPTLSALFAHCGTAFSLSLDMGSPDAVERVVETADRYGARDRLWLTYWRLPALAIWRKRWPDLRLVYPTIPLGPGRLDPLLPRLRGAGVDVLNIHHRICTPALAAHVRAAGLDLFAWGVREDRQLARVVRAGVDGVFCDNVENAVLAARSG